MVAFKNNWRMNGLYDTMKGIIIRTVSAWGAPAYAICGGVVDETRTQSQNQPKQKQFNFHGQIFENAITTKLSAWEKSGYIFAGITDLIIMLLAMAGNAVVAASVRALCVIDLVVKSLVTVMFSAYIFRC